MYNLVTNFIERKPSESVSLNKTFCGYKRLCRDYLLKWRYVNALLCEAGQAIRVDSHQVCV